VAPDSIEERVGLPGYWVILADHAPQPAGGLFDVRDELTQLRRHGGIAGEDAGGDGDGVDRCTQVMAQDADEALADLVAAPV
jgi:hypothetical protein